MKILHLDAFAGISGDMTVAALRDLGVPESVFSDALAALPIPLPSCRFERSMRGGIAGWRFLVEGHDGNEGKHADHHHHDHAGHHHHDHVYAAHGHSHDPHHGHHQHGQEHTHGRNHSEIRDLLERSTLTASVKARALSVFRRIAEAEGGIHGVPAESVGFHEVGAEDSIADIVAACAGLDHLGVASISCSELKEGTGHIHCAHGTFPLPAPATLALLQGIPLQQVAESWEHITPTGAALVAEFATSFGSMPGMSVSKIGYGLGSRETPGRPNALRLILGESDATGHSTPVEAVVELRTNLDDLTPEHAADALELLIAEGALDATLTPAVFKKGRPGWVLEVLCKLEDHDRFLERVLRLTTAFGVRSHTMSRLILERHHRSVETPYGPIEVKVGTLRGETLQESPEFSSCSTAAKKHGVPVRLVHQAALKALGSN